MSAADTSQAEDEQVSVEGASESVTVEQSRTPDEPSDALHSDEPKVDDNQDTQQQSTENDDVTAASSNRKDLTSKQDEPKEADEKQATWSSSDVSSTYTSSYAPSNTSESAEPENRPPAADVDASQPPARAPASTLSSGQSESAESSTNDVTLADTQSKTASDTTHWTGSVAKEDENVAKDRRVSQQLAAVDETREVRNERLEQGTGVHFVKTSRLDQDKELVRSVTRELEGAEDEDTVQAKPTGSDVTAGKDAEERKESERGGSDSKEETGKESLSEQKETGDDRTSQAEVRKNTFMIHDAGR